MTDAQSAQTALDKLIEAVEAGGVRNGVSGLKAFEDMARAFLDLPSSNAAFRAYHGSLDAALALHEALLPGWAHLVRSSDVSDGMNHSMGHSFANVWREADSPNSGGDCSSAWTKTPARAWLLAILRAHRSTQP